MPAPTPPDPPVVGINTLLEGLLPDTAANYGSLATFAAKTETDVEDELTGAETTRWGGGILDSLFMGLEQGKPFVVALINAILTNMFPGLTAAFSNINDAFGELLSQTSGKWRDIRNAQDAANYANAQLAVSNRPIRDLFDGAEGDLAADWDTDYYDSVGGLAGGKVQQDGDGNAWWDGFGGAAKGARNRWNTDTTATDIQIVTIVMPLAVQKKSLLGGQSHTRLLARMNSANDTYVYAQVRYDEVEIGYSVSGSETAFVSTGQATHDGDVWDFIVGNSVNAYKFQLKRNGLVILEYDDTGHASTKGSSNRYVGFEFYAANRGIAQTSPGTIAVFSADDN